jgi:hypothetical protein
MKKILVLLIAISNNFGFSQKYYPSYRGIQSKIIDFDIKNPNVYNGKTELTKITKFDSITRITLERFIIDRINYHRQLLGRAPLKYEPALRPMCYHQVVYQRLAKQQTHCQIDNISNWNELNFIDRKKLVTDIEIGRAGEGLIDQSIQIPGSWDNTYPAQTYKSVVDKFFTPGYGYPTSPTHWNDIMSADYDCIYIYYDFNWLGGELIDCYTPSNVTLVYAKKK